MQPNNNDEPIIIPAEDVKSDATAASDTSSELKQTTPVSNAQDVTTNVDPKKPEDKKEIEIPKDDKSEDIAKESNEFKSIAEKARKLELERNDYSKKTSSYSRGIVKTIQQRAARDGNMDGIARELIEDPEQYEIVRQAFKDIGVEGELPDFETFRKNWSETASSGDEQPEGDLTTLIDKRVEEKTRVAELQRNVQNSFLEFVKENGLDDLDPEKIGNDPDKMKNAAQEAQNLLQLAAVISQNRDVDLKGALKLALMTDPNRLERIMSDEKQKAELMGYAKANNFKAGTSSPVGTATTDSSSNTIRLDPNSEAGREYERLKQTKGVDFANKVARRWKTDGYIN